MRASAASVASEARAPGWSPLPLRWPTPTALPFPSLAPRDQGFKDRRGGRDRGNRCFAHFKTGPDDAAEAACMQGLAVATDDVVRGAIYHSLGRIAEERGNDEAAAIYYRTSLALRDDEATAERFARALRSPAAREH
ncbi:hypothetical protein SAMN02745121_06612 [Nannocystis exedens]|uniref:Tetratricopeptide repeat-containing protein n=1 Tax=Nannocystis exedens TaxID=54 RepID=A0A1I2FE58_9BACT|nr:tetratricopeptide repeat protein [Nannocystis exedens]PCC70469.1 hypothetical protein NAEX_03532 [Nannocystis exedens]SFF03804.1 hypothetical protein SAMN02745121_06612 [Nannocystis exedens]